MTEPTNQRIDEADQLMKRSQELSRRSNELLQEAAEIYRKESLTVSRKENDKLINKKEAISLLWFESYTALRDWERKVNPLGYLRFTSTDKILRSEVLRFRDDIKTGLIPRKLKKLNRMAQ